MTVDHHNPEAVHLPNARYSDPMVTISDELLRQRVRDTVKDMRTSPLVWRILGSPLTSVIVAGIIGAWLTHYYDQQRLKTENELIKSRAAAERVEAQRELEIARAFATFEEVSKVLDSRLWRARRVIWAADEKASDAELQRRWESYREAVNEWNENLNRNLSRVERYFGPSARGNLEGPIADGMRAVNAELRAPTLSPRDLHARVDDLNNKIYAFNTQLLGMVEGGNVGAFRTDE